MRITESKLRNIIRSVILESIEKRYNSGNLKIKDHVREARGGEIVSVKHCGDDEEYINDIYILVRKYPNGGAVVYQDNSDNSQMIEVSDMLGARDFENIKKEFDRITVGEELYEILDN